MRTAVGLSLLLIGCNAATNGSTDGGADLSVAAAPDLSNAGATDLAVSPNGNRGSVVLVNGATASSAAAQFYNVSGAYMSSCTGNVPTGDCILVSGCTITGGPGTFVPQSAGVVTITGGKKMVTLTPGGDNMYAPFSDTTSTLWNGGETLAISATGATVPAFSGSVTAPAPFNLTAPVLPASGPLTVAANQDLMFSWTGASGGAVQVLVEDASKAPYVMCTFTGSKGTGTIPKAAFSGIAGGATGTASLSVNSSARMTAADWTIDLSAGVPAVQGSRSLAVVDLTFQ